MALIATISGRGISVPQPSNILKKTSTQCANSTIQRAIIALLSAFMAHFATLPVVLAEIPEETIIRAIVGEAANQGRIGMLAVAEAIRNRGHLSGVYGVHRDLSKEPKKIFEIARQVWKESATTNLVKGADHWESTDFPRPEWSKNMIATVTIGKHVFYRRR